MKSILLIPLSVFFSFCSSGAFLYFCKENKRPIKSLLICGIAALISSLLTYVVYNTFLFSLSAYEIIFLSSGISVFLLFVFGYITKGEIGIYDVLLFFCIECLIVVLYSVLTYGQATIHSDTATATLLSRSQVNNRSFFPTSWNYVNGSVWTLGIATVVAPFTYIFQNQSFARMLGSAVFIIITIACIIYTSRKHFQSQAWVIAIPLFLLFLFGQKDQVLYQGSYTGNMLWGTLIPALAFAVFYRSEKNAGILYAFFIFVLAISGIAVFSGHIIPIMGAIIVLWFSENKCDISGKTKEVLSKIAILLIPAVIGYTVNIILCKYLQINQIINNTSGNTTAGILFAESLEKCWENIRLYFTDYLICFGYSGSQGMFSLSGLQNSLSILFCLLICGFVPCLQWRKRKEETKEVQFFLLYCIIHNAIIFFMAVFFSLTIERYILSSIFLLIIISSRYIFSYWLKPGTAAGRILSAGFILCIVFQCVMLTGLSANWEETVKNKKSFNQQLLDKGLTKGYASYWHAYNNEIYSDLGIEYGAIEFENGKIFEYDWLVDSKVFIPEEKKTFLILEPYEKQLINFDLEERFGQIEETFTVDGLSIYIFNHDIAMDFYQRGIYEAKDLMAMNNVSLENNMYSIKPGGIVFGPADSIGKGTYRITFVGENMGAAECDVFSNSAMNAITYKEISRSDDEIVVDMIISRPVYDIEYRTFNKMDPVIILEKITVEHID